MADINYQEIKDAFDVTPEMTVEGTDLDPNTIPFYVHNYLGDDKDDDHKWEQYCIGAIAFPYMISTKDETKAISYQAMYETIMGLSDEQLKEKVVLDGEGAIAANYCGQWVVLVVQKNI